MASIFTHILNDMVKFLKAGTAIGINPSGVANIQGHILPLILSVSVSMVYQKFLSQERFDTEVLLQSCPIH